MKGTNKTRKERKGMKVGQKRKKTSKEERKSENEKEKKRLIKKSKTVEKEEKKSEKRIKMLLLWVKAKDGWVYKDRDGTLPKKKRKKKNPENTKLWAKNKGHLFLVKSLFELLSNHVFHELYKIVVCMVKIHDNKPSALPRMN